MSADLSRRAALAALVSAAIAPIAPADAGEPDPIFAAIEAAHATDAAFTASLVDLDEDDPVMMGAANAAADAHTSALDALGKIRPTTPAGLLALIRFYAEDAAVCEPYSVGAVSLGRLLAVVEPRGSPA